jgi:uncharacterized membrane protein
MTTAVLTNRLELDSVADKVLKAAARLWYLTAVIGQLVFAFTVASFYASAAVRGNFEAWNRFMSHGYVAGDTIGNVTVAVHLLAAVFIVLSGAVQLVPQIRHRAPFLHRWNGRLYVLSAFTVSTAGLYMQWVRGNLGDISQNIGISLNAVLIMLCAAMALRYASARATAVPPCPSRSSPPPDQADLSTRTRLSWYTAPPPMSESRSSTVALTLVPSFE